MIGNEELQRELVGVPTCAAAHMDHLTCRVCRHVLRHVGGVCVPDPL